MIIGLAYKARIGKDLAANYMVKKYGFKKLAFAEPLKEGAKIIYGFTDEQVYGDLKEVIDPFWGETPRKILQTAGTDALRNHHRQDIWVMATKRKIVERSNTNFIISDVRFSNEAAMIKDLGGFVIRIDANFPGQQHIKTGFHASEVEMEKYSNWDWILKNNSTIEEYYKKIDDMYEFFEKDYKKFQKDYEELVSGNQS